MVYLDYSATTPVNDTVLNSFVEVTKKYTGNPNSLHKLGLEAKKLIDEATEQIAHILSVKPSEIIYTSGASESNNTAIKGVVLANKKGKHIITTKFEHSSIIAPLTYLQNNGYEVDFVNILDNGLVDKDDLKRLLKEDTVLVTIGSVNSETGVEQNVNELARIVKENSHAIFHSDMTQSIGKRKVNLNNIDLVSFSAQKFYGFKGIGGLIKKENIKLIPLIHGGKSTTMYRSGTPSPSLIVSISKALRLAYEDFEERTKHVEELNNYLRDNLNNIENIKINSPITAIPHILNISINNIKPETMLHALAEKDIYISTQTACAMGEQISEPVYALTKDKERASHSLRISLSYLTTKEEIDYLINNLKELINKYGDQNESR